MLVSGIINPQLLHLLSRVRHTNTLVIADAAFPFWPQIETVDLALVKGIPTIPQVLAAILPNFSSGPVFMAEEFLSHNDLMMQGTFRDACRGIKMHFEPHLDFKKRVPGAIGLVRTGDTTAYGNIILVSV